MTFNASVAWVRNLSQGTRRSIAAALLVVVAIGLLIAVVTMVARSNDARDAALRREQHSYDIMVLTRSLDASMARSEAALARYVVSSDRKVGTIFYDEWRRAMSQLRQLDRLTSGQPGQQRLVRKLEALAADREKELAAAASFANVGKGWYAIGMFSKAGESSNVRAISETLEQIAARERERLGQRSEATLFSAERANWFATLLSVLGLSLMGLAILLGWLAAAAVAQRAHAAEAMEVEADRAAQLEAAVAERTQELSEANRRLLAESETRARAEAQLAQAQKMEAIGQLTGGVAHDFNNLLMAVLGNLELLAKHLVDDPKASRLLDGATRGARRGAALTQRLLAFGRRQDLTVKPLDLADLVHGMDDLLARSEYPNRKAT